MQGASIYINMLAPCTDTKLSRFLITELFEISIFDYICSIINKKGGIYDHFRIKSTNTKRDRQ
jgi:hypothetical protein